MKLKTWHLFLVITILFGCSFYVVNLNFDKFYRVNGINNDNRVLIEKYLDDDEQAYLVENQIPIDQFIDYIEYDDFHLSNYQYYNFLEDSGRYSKKSEILKTGNSLSTRLNYLYKSHAQNEAKILIDKILEMAFLNEEEFRFDYIDLYVALKPLYHETDYSYVQDSEMYVKRLNMLGIKDNNKVKETIKMLATAYNQKSLKALLTEELPKGTEIVYNPYELSTLVDQHHYIGQYEPSGLLLTQDIPRVRYAMYLQSDAYSALLKMYEELSKIYSGFLLREAYLSPEALLDQEVGYNEYQLGLTICVTQSQKAYKDFETTEMSKWLQEHAYEYGFILRYPQHKASITNHAYDAHVYRYVGKSLAKSLHESEMTLEEYQTHS